MEEIKKYNWETMVNNKDLTSTVFKQVIKNEETGFGDSCNIIPPKNQHHWDNAFNHLKPHHNHCNHLVDKIHVITMVSNPVRYDTRYNLYRRFVQHMHESGVVHLWTVEIQQGNRAFQVTHKNNPYHIQLRTEDELWIKENAINLAINRLTPLHRDWQYAAWIDCDIEFQRPDWLIETLEELQVAHWVQMFQTAVDLGPDMEVIHTHKGFIYSYLMGKPFINNYYTSYHPGFCWAATRESLTGVGLLIDKAILGSADRHMAMNLIGMGNISYNQDVHPDYKDMVDAWEKRADQYIKRDIGYVKGNISHFWHGKKRDRQYNDRWKILVEHQYSPYRHVYPDWQGVYQLDLDALNLRDAIKKYFRSRNENSIDLV